MKEKVNTQKKLSGQEKFDIIKDAFEKASKVIGDRDTIFTTGVLEDVRFSMIVDNAPQEKNICIGLIGVVDTQENPNVKTLLFEQYVNAILCLMEENKELYETFCQMFSKFLEMNHPDQIIRQVGKPIPN